MIDIGDVDPHRICSLDILETVGVVGEGAVSVVGVVACRPGIADDDEFGVAVIVHVAECWEKSGDSDFFDSGFRGDIGETPGVGLVWSVIAEQAIGGADGVVCGDEEVEVAVEVVVTP